MMNVVPDDFSKLGADGFESLSQALALCVLGSGVTVFGDGPDGGREATFDGRVNFPNSQNAWDGYGVLQAKYKSRVGVTGADNRTFLTQVRNELDEWADRTKRRNTAGRRPKYLIFTTNVSLSSSPGTGGKDVFDALLREYQQRLGLVDWRVWDADQISRLLDLYPALRASYAGLLTHNEVLAQLLRQLSAPITIQVAAPATGNELAAAAFIGPGEPGNESAFQAAFDAVGGADLLGAARAHVETIGNGYLQRFDGGATGTERVLCAPAGHPVVAMDRTVWDQLQSVGGRHGGVEHIGFPLPPSTGRPYIGADWTEILLVGGDWGRLREDERRGRVVRGEDGGVAWRPDIVFDDEASRTRAWRVDSRSASAMDVRLAASGQILIRGDGLQITETGRRRMLEAVATNGLDDLLIALARRFRCAPGSGWSEISEDYRNTGRQAAYEYLIAGTDGRVAVRAGLQISLPASHSIEATVIAEIRVDFDALRPSATSETGTYTPVAPELALHFDELSAFVEAGWHTTTHALLLAASPAPARLVPAGASRIELYLENERPENRGIPRTRRLLEMIDLSRFGRSRITALNTLAVGITTPTGLACVQIAPHSTAALNHVARSFGFMNAPGDDAS
jgi:hypothetical protein